MDKKIFITLTLYLTALLASNTLGIKLMPFVFGTHLSTAIFAFPIVFLTTDVIGEGYGKSLARLFVKMGFLSSLFFLGLNWFSNLMPSSPDFFLLKSYNEVFSLSFRFTLASLCAFLIGEYQDVYSFFFFKNRFGGRWFWLRSNLSNLWGQLVDSTIWSLIAFLGVYPFKTIVLIIIPWWLFKFSMGVVYTPLSYLGIRLLKGKMEK